MKTIRSFGDFVQDLREAGFSMGGERDGGIRLVFLRILPDGRFLGRRSDEAGGENRSR